MSTQLKALSSSVFLSLNGGKFAVVVDEEGVIGKRADREIDARMIWRWGLVYMKRAEEFHHILDRDYA
ncbi:nuclear pore complex protein [Moniliophthora roreri]|nr:nuclear pore complex protein [Moniliophthora roreri]